jgi:diacylglycerol kinase family enzyme
VKIALIHNPNAFRGETKAADVLRVFERAGHDVSYVSTQEPNWQRVISQEIARAVIVGGDGTVQLVAPHLDGTPFSIIPAGTANNIAQCLHQTSNTELIASQLDRAKIRYLDHGRAKYAAKSEPFLEAAGMGVFSELIVRMRGWPKKAEMQQAGSREEKLARALEQLRAISHGYHGMDLKLKADNNIISDRFLLVAVMNIELIGPRLHLAPGADPSDGYFDLVFVRERSREHLCRWLESQSPGQQNVADLESRRCRRVEICTSYVAPVHIDSHLMQKPHFPLVIELEPAVLKYIDIGNASTQPT